MPFSTVFRLDPDCVAAWSSSLKASTDTPVRADILLKSSPTLAKTLVAALEKVWQLYKDKDVIFIGVDVQDRAADAQTFITEFGITYPNGPDAGSKISIDYGVSGLPVTFFTNREGRIISRWVGAISEGLLIAHIEEILQ